MNRRTFLTSAAMLTAGASALPLFAESTAAPAFKTNPKKAFLAPVPDEKAIEKMLSHGFKGMEVRGNLTIQQAEAAKKIADRMGFKIHSLMGGGSPERLAIAEALGADTVLLVPGRVSGVPMPKQWEFKIEFDEKTNRLLKVVEGDNSPYQAYIDAHNREMEAARKRIEELTPIAEKKGIVIALENVWNNMWVHPNFAANFILSFQCPTIQAYVDLGNHMIYANSEDWFKYLGKTIRRIHLKDFKRNPNGQGGNWCRLREGSVDWPRMRQEMDKIGYDSWCTVEPEGGIGMTMEYQSWAADLILAGK